VLQVSSERTVTFPEGFVWGAATASYQIEGGIHEGGRGPSIWDEFSHRPGAVHNGDNGDVACDHYHRVEEDLDLMARLGLGSYRLSVAWPRIQPDGKGPANEAGLDFYRRLVDGLCERGITPAVTLYHWDLPQALGDAGGWTARDTAERFAEYAALVGEALADRVELWITLNEPYCSSWVSYAQGRHAPGHRNTAEALSANHHLLLAHGLAVPALRAAGASRVGITLNVAPVEPVSQHPLDLAAAQRLDGNLNRLFLDPIFNGSYPADMMEHYGSVVPGFSVVEDGDLEVISAPLDFLGVNFYEPFVVCDPERVDAARALGFSVGTPESSLYADDVRAVRVGNPDADRTLMGWEVHPEGLTELLTSLKRDYTDLPMYITENGAAFPDYAAPDGQVRDPERIAYLDGHLRALHDAISAGVDVRGYYTWSLLDNFEWAFGYAKRFGIVYVDFPTGTRTPKSSFEWYRRVARTNSVGVLPA
jgi:beta-glucosidase